MQTLVPLIYLCAVAESGQTLAQTTGCLDILLDHFRYFAMLNLPDINHTKFKYVC